MPKIQTTCRICRTHDNHELFIAREMMFGTREEFQYFQCTNCDCLQIYESPVDLHRFYPQNYYSLKSEIEDDTLFFTRHLLKLRFRNAIFGKGYKLNKLLAMFVDLPTLKVDTVLPVARILQVAGVRNFNARFLDIGCGSSSQWLTDLRKMGFNNLFGADPFIEKDLNKPGIQIQKKDISELTGTYDLITFHHSLEHIPDQESTLNFAKKLLSPSGVLLIRIPTVSSYAWRHYGTDWVELDPPRHLYLHSRKSIQLLADNAGLRLYQTIGDSLDFEFYGSEQYRKDIPLTAPESYWANRSSKIFSKAEILKFNQLAEIVNNNNDSGRACFFFRSST